MAEKQDDLMFHSRFCWGLGFGSSMVGMLDCVAGHAFGGAAFRAAFPQCAVCDALGGQGFSVMGLRMVGRLLSPSALQADGGDHAGGNRAPAEQRGGRGAGRLRCGSGVACEVNGFSWGRKGFLELF
jgi:hypothetical protein